MTVAAEFWPEVLTVCLVPMTHALAQLPLLMLFLLQVQGPGTRLYFLFSTYHTSLPHNT